MDQTSKPIKIMFLRGSSKTEKHENGFLAKLPGALCVRKGEKNAHFRAHYLLWPKNFWGQNSENQETL